MTIIGPVLLTKDDKDYMETIQELIKLWDLDVQIYAPVYRESVPVYMCHAKIFFNIPRFAGLDRSCLEAMACEVPILSTHVCTKEILPPDLRKEVTTDDNIEAIADLLHTLLSKTQQERDEIGRRLRKVILDGHDLYTLWDRILPIIEKEVSK